MILVVDDNEIILEMVGNILRTEGYEFDSAEDSDEAIDKSEKNQYDLILLDLLMPGKSGLEISKAIRRGTGKSRSSYIIALTGALMQVSMQDILDAGINEVTMKPVGYEELKGIVSQHVKVKGG